jgi:hypothetical protein
MRRISFEESRDRFAEFSIRLPKSARLWSPVPGAARSC